MINDNKSKLDGKMWDFVQEFKTLEEARKFVSDRHSFPFKENFKIVNQRDVFGNNNYRIYKRRVTYDEKK